MKLKLVIHVLEICNLSHILYHLSDFNYGFNTNHLEIIHLLKD
jgi:hypothetical protein